MEGLTVLLGLLCGALLFRQLRMAKRLRALAERVDGYCSGTAPMVDVALEEDTIARLQNAVAELQQALERQKALNAEECSRTTALIADISHQLKTPLTTLRLYTELDGAEHCDASLSQIQRMEDLIHALLRLERLCADGYAFAFAEAQAEDIILEQWQSLRPHWPEKHLRVEGTAAIRCDEKWLGEAFLNLLKNACEHTGPDGVIRVTMERTDSLFFCVMEDNGGGVHDEELSKLFRRFYRAERSDSKGVGIGLAIVKEIIGRHHGTITAENGMTGLKMTISLPMLDVNLTDS